MEALIRPETVDIPRYRFCFSAKPTEGSHMVIRNVEAHRRVEKRILSELRIGSGHRDFSDVRHKANIGSGQQPGTLFEAAVGMADCEEWKLHSSPLSGLFESAALMGGDMVGLVAFDFVLGIVFRGVMHMALVVKVSGVDRDDGARHPARLGI